MESKGKKIGQAIMLLGLLLILAGVAINFYNEMFAPKQQEEEETTPSTEEVVVEAPTDMEAVSERINTDLKEFLTYYYEPTADSGSDLLASPTKRFQLVCTVLAKDSSTQKETADYEYYYVGEDSFKGKYTEIFGGNDNYDADIATAYTIKDTIDGILGEGNIGWLATYPVVSVERTFTATAATLDEETKVITINGTYSDSQLGAETANGSFVLTYADNYIISLTLTQNA